MIDWIKGLSDSQAKKVLVDIMDVYLAKGFGMMNKTEIETLLYGVFRKHGLLTGKCFDDSFMLQITEEKARRLIYESQVKYSSRDKDEHLRFLRKEVGKCMERAHFSKNDKEIKFAIEDKYVRVALNAKLRDNHYFADTSFNKDIISLDAETLYQLVVLLVPNIQQGKVIKHVNAIALSDEVKAKNGLDFIKALFKDIIVQGCIKGVQQIGSMLTTL